MRQWLRAWPPVIGLGVIAVAAGCSSSNHPPDERGAVTRSLARVESKLVAAGNITGHPTSAVGSCVKHRAGVSWEVALSARAMNLPALQRSSAVTDSALNELPSGNRQFVDAPDDLNSLVMHDAAGTVLVVSVPGGRYARIDGIASC